MKKSSFRLFPAACLCLALALMLINPGCTLDGAKRGLLLWYDSVVPALFPFMVLSGMIVASGGIEILSAPFHLALRPLLGLSEPGCYVLVAGLLCGYPMGAKTCADFVREGRITDAEGRLLMAVCNHPSPMFLLGFAHPLIAASAPLPLFLLAVYAPVLLIAGIARLVYPPDGAPGRPGKRPAGKCRPPAPDSPGLDRTVMNAFEILFKIGGYLMIFSILVEFLLRARAIPALIRLPVIGLMEMTTGVRQLSALLPDPVRGAAVCACLTFGGLSGVFQTKSVLGDPALPASGPTVPKHKKAGLSIRHYVFWKTLHGVGSFALYLGLSPLFRAGPPPLR